MNAAAVWIVRTYGYIGRLRNPNPVPKRYQDWFGTYNFYIWLRIVERLRAMNEPAALKNLAFTCHAQTRPHSSDHALSIYFGEYIFQQRDLHSVTDKPQSEEGDYKNVHVNPEFFARNRGPAQQDRRMIRLVALSTGANMRAFGKEGCLDLARTDPLGAAENADSISYFVANYENMLH